MMKNKQPSLCAFSISILIVIILVLSVPAFASANVQSFEAFSVDSTNFSEGAVYKIDSPESLKALSQKVNDGNDMLGVTFYLEKDIIFKNVINYENDIESNWVPIGKKYQTPFRGVFNGNGYKISGICVTEKEDCDFYGLFGIVSGGIVRNVGLVQSYISGKDYVGGIVGYLNADENDASVLYCYNAATVNGTSQNVGGIVGYMTSASGNSAAVSNCFNIGDISNNTFFLGGIVGFSISDDDSNALVQNCFNAGALSGFSHVGGIVGSNYSIGGDVRITNSYNIGQVSGEYRAGAIAGENKNLSGGAVIDNCCFDKQMCTVDGENGFLTKDMLGAALDEVFTSEEWIFSDKLYPTIKGLGYSDAASVAVCPIILSDNDTVDNVTTSLKLISNGSLWSSKNGDILEASVNGRTLSVNSGDSTKTIFLNGDKSVGVFLENVSVGANNEISFGDIPEAKQPSLLKNYWWAALLVALILIGLVYITKKNREEKSQNSVNRLENTEDSIEKLIDENQEQDTDSREISNDIVNDNADVSQNPDKFEVKAEESHKEPQLVTQNSEALDDEQGDSFVMTGADGNQITVRFRYSFLARLIRSDDEVKNYYGVLKNKFLSYKNVKSRLSSSVDTISSGRIQLAKFSMTSKTLKLQLALNVNDENLPETKYHQTDVSGLKKFEKVPFSVKVKSPLGLRRAIELIEYLMASFRIEFFEEKNEDYLTELEFDSVGGLISRGLIKVYGADGNEASELVGANIKDVIEAKTEYKKLIDISEPIQVVSEVKADAVNEMMSDEYASAIIEETTSKCGASHGKFGYINIDTLAKTFKANTHITIETLKEHKLIPKNVGRVKVLARGTLDKPLVIEMNSFSLQAVKMITLTGGKVIKIIN